MAKVHGKGTFVSLDASDISSYTNSTVFNRESDTHDTTAYGVDDHEHDPGLLLGTITIGGFYDDTAVTGPAEAIEPLLGTTVEFVYQAKGTGSGLPQKSCNVIVQNFNVSAPVADMVTWTSELLITGSVDRTAQAV